MAWVGWDKRGLVADMAIPKEGIRNVAGNAKVLRRWVCTVIHLKNEDDVRHDFRSEIFQGSHTQVEGRDSISYGTGISGVFLEPGSEVDIRFTIDRPGQYQFQCSIHPEMTGEIFLVTVGAA